jgi:hypothetical protein
MSKPLFHANCVAVVDDEFSRIVGFADQQFDTKRYLQFQLSRVSDTQDEALGLNTYYVEKDDQSNSCYGGIESIDLHKNTITLKLDDVGSQRLDSDRIVLITFDTDDKTLGELRSGLAAIFSGTNTLRDHIDD